MSTFVSRSHPSFFDQFASSNGVVASVRRILAWPFEVAKARTDLARLGGLSDYELRDIGLSRQDLRNATALPLDKDPTLFLAMAVRANSIEQSRHSA